MQQNQHFIFSNEEDSLNDQQILTEKFDLQDQQIKKYLSPPNPIRQIDQLFYQNQIRFKLKQQRTRLLFSNNKLNLSIQSSQNKLNKFYNTKREKSLIIKNSYFHHQYNRQKLNENLVYSKINNSYCNYLKSIPYKASLFIDNKQIKNYYYKETQSFYQYLIENNQKYLPKYTNYQDQNTLMFDSNFESGNLLFAYKISDYEYDLVLQNDINSRGYTQWFYFSVEKMKYYQTYKFNIINLTKNSSLFNCGLIPLTYSEKLYNTQQIGWQRRGFNVRYFKNQTKVQYDKTQTYFTLSWEYKMITKQDKIYFSHCYPYTFKHLRKFLKSLQFHQYITQQNLCLTELKIQCPIVTVKKSSNFKKSCIIIIARQHAGQTPSSFVVEGILNYFTSEKQQVKDFLEQYELKIIPMINIDGVVLGNYRCGFGGYDMNRKWLQSNDNIITVVKQLIKSIKRTMSIHLFLDLHGHSRKNNSFFFGNVNFNDPIQPRKLPYLSSKINSDIKFEQCSFAYDISKKNTARIALSQFIEGESYTFEASLCGRIKNQRLQYFNPSDYRNLGRDIMEGIYQMLNLKKIMNHKKYKETLNILQALDNPNLIKLGEQNNQISQSQKQQQNFKKQNQIPLDYKRFLYKNRLKIKQRNNTLTMIKTPIHLFKSNRNKLKIQSEQSQRQVQTNNSYQQKQKFKSVTRLLQLQDQIKKRPLRKIKLRSNENKKLVNILNKQKYNTISTKNLDINIQYSFICSSFDIKKQLNNSSMKYKQSKNSTSFIEKSKSNYPKQSFLLSKPRILKTSLEANHSNDKIQSIKNQNNLKHIKHLVKNNHNN